MAREKAKVGTVDAAASYRDPRAVPLRDAGKLLDLDYREIFDDVNRHELMAGYVKSGRYRIIGYEKPRRLSDEPVLVAVELVKAAFRDLRSNLVLDPVHDRVVQRSTVVGTPSARMLREMPDLREKLREHQRLAALPPAIDWTACTIRAGRYAFVNCKAIRAVDLTIKPKPEVAPARQRPGPPRGKRRAPNDASKRLQKMIEALPDATSLKAWEVAEQIVAAHPEVMHTDKGGKLVNPDGWWTSGTLERNVSMYKDGKG